MDVVERLRNSTICVEERIEWGRGHSLPINGFIFGCDSSTGVDGEMSAFRGEDRGEKKGHGGAIGRSSMGDTTGLRCDMPQGLEEGLREGLNNKGVESSLPSSGRS